MKKLLSVLALTLCTSWASAAIAYRGVSAIPVTDNTDGGETGPTITMTQPTSSAAGDFILAIINHRQSLATQTWELTTLGGQNWHVLGIQRSNATTVSESALVWCIFNGTWGANFVATVTGTGTNNLGVQGWMFAWSGVDGQYPFDVFPISNFTDAVNSTIATSAWTTVAANTLAVVMAASRDDNSWTVDNTFVTASGAGNIYWRQLNGADSSAVACVKAIAGAGSSIGVTTLTQSVNGPDGGTIWQFVLRPSGLSRRGPL